MSKKRIRLLKKEIVDNYLDLLGKRSKAVETDTVKGIMFYKNIWTGEERRYEEIIDISTDTKKLLWQETHRVIIIFGDIKIGFYIGKSRYKKFASTKTVPYPRISYLTIKKGDMENSIRVSEAREPRFLNIVNQAIKVELVKGIDVEEDFFYSLENDIANIERQLGLPS